MKARAPPPPHAAYGVVSALLLACAVTAAHRTAAFAACAALVDEVKLQLPIWKRQEFTDGTEQWVNSP